MAENVNISPEMIKNLANMLKDTSNSSEDNSENNSSLDLETILKIKNIIEAMNNNDDPKSNLLYSLKPYLRKNKQAKLDQYINLLKISQVTNLFKNEKGEIN